MIKYLFNKHLMWSMLNGLKIGKTQESTVKKKIWKKDSERDEIWRGVWYVRNILCVLRIKLELGWYQ